MSGLTTGYAIIAVVLLVAFVGGFLDGVHKGRLSARRALLSVFILEAEKAAFSGGPPLPLGTANCLSQARKHWLAGELDDAQSSILIVLRSGIFGLGKWRKLPEVGS